MGPSQTIYQDEARPIQNWRAGETGPKGAAWLHEVTQWEIVASVERILGTYLVLVLETMLAGFLLLPGFSFR
jgi:hypothetical protein